MSTAEVAALEAELKDYRLQLETVTQQLENDPGNQGLEDLRNDIQEVIDLTESNIADLKPLTAATAKSTTNNHGHAPSPPSVREKWSKENHPAYRAGYKAPEVEPEESNTPITFSVNDNVLARWKSGDGGFYNARITSITGSSSNPVYIVSFKNYATTETCYSKDVRPLSSHDANKKRKADNMSGSSTPLPPSSSSAHASVSSSAMNPGVISAASTVDPSLAQQAKREPSKVTDGPTRPAKIPRKVKANKELEAGKAKWQDFAAKTKGGKQGKKDSMFRIGESVNARVGFTGSGQEMRKDPTRSRHIYQQGGEE